MLHVHLLLEAVWLQATMRELKVLVPMRLQQNGRDMDLEFMGPGKERVSRAEVLSRPRLPNSQSVRVDFNVDNLCVHSQLRKRGGKTYWYACRHCPCRWPRDPMEDLVDG